MTYYPYVPSQTIQGLGHDISRSVVSDIRENTTPISKFTVDAQMFNEWKHLDYRIPPAFAGETTLEHDARQWASYWHRDQKRKYTGQPYIEHPAEVVAILRAQEVDGPIVLAAAWLHDVVEDCSVDLSQLITYFGMDVAMMVSELTDVSKPSDGNRATRKAIDLAHISNGCPASKMIKLADIISNSKSIIAHDPKFAKAYLPEKRAMLNVLRGAHEGLWNEANRICREEGY